MVEEHISLPTVLVSRMGVANWTLFTPGLLLTDPGTANISQQKMRILPVSLPDFCLWYPINENGKSLFLSFSLFEFRLAGENICVNCLGGL